jgi:putative acetyltransferase
MLIRRESAKDIPAVAAVTTAAFRSERNPGPVETALLGELREDPGWIPELSLVAVDPGGEVTGHVVCTRGRVGGTEAVGLGPISVRPDRQGRGVGSALMHAVLGAAEARNVPLVALLGEPRYYTRFGFRPSTDYRVTAPDPAWGPYFQIRALAAWSDEIRGTFGYSEPFTRLT